MAKANVDPAELRRFARDLKKFTTELQGLTTGLAARLRNLERAWQDQEQRKFSEDFEQTIKTLSRFVTSSDEYITYLGKKASHIEEYLQQR